jgi:hypothetical protein
MRLRAGRRRSVVGIVISVMQPRRIWRLGISRSKSVGGIDLEWLSVFAWPLPPTHIIFFRNDVTKRKNVRLERFYILYIFFM